MGSGHVSRSSVRLSAGVGSILTRLSKRKIIRIVFVVVIVVLSADSLKASGVLQRM